MANVQELKNVGYTIVDLVYAVKDGLDMADVTYAQNFIVAVMAAADDIKEDVDSAALDILSGAAESLANRRRIPAPPVVP